MNTLGENTCDGLSAELPLPIQEQTINDARPIQPAPLETPLLKEEQSSPQEINGITLCSEAEFQEITTKEKERYPILEKGKRKRLALIICNVKFSDENIKERKGANIDLDGMRELLEGLDYNVQWKTDLTAEEMRALMKTFAANDHKESDSTFLVFMSHGERDIIYGTDFKRSNTSGEERVPGGLYVDDIFKAFNNENCPGLRDKPKMVIIQACRGHNRSRILVSDGAQQAQSIGQEDLENDAARLILKERDFICFYSTTPDTVSFRDTKRGSLFIQCLIDVMKQNAHNSSIEDIFRKVQLSFKDDLQMPTQDRKTLLKKFFLFPGY